jgi:hypothetical protein
MELTAVLVILLIIAFAGGGVILIISALTFGRRAKTNISWPAVKGKVLSSEVVESSGLTDQGVPFSSFKPVIRFKYGVNQVEYISIHIGQSVLQANHPAIQQISEKFPIGKSVTVHFDPQNPTEAILAPQVPVARPLIITGAGLLFISASLACIAGTLFLIYFFTH